MGEAGALFRLSSAFAEAKLSRWYKPMLRSAIRPRTMITAARNARPTASRHGRDRCLVPLGRAARPLTGATSELRLVTHGARRPRLPRSTRHLPRNQDVIRR